MPTDPPGRTTLRRFALTLSSVLALALAGCAAPAPDSGGVAPAATPSDATSTRVPAAGTGTTATSPVRDPANDGAVAAGGPVEIDRSCSTDAECTVKNIGTCCGYYPVCVNVDSPTDPEGVKAQCAKSGMASVCGFPAITRCQCVAGQCEGSSQALLD